jgi:hypothetical protein
MAEVQQGYQAVSFIWHYEIILEIALSGGQAAWSVVLAS